MRPTLRRRRRSHLVALFESLEIRRLLAFRIGSLTDAPDPCPSGQALTLTANDVTTISGHPIEIDFFRETNGVAGLQPLQDLLVDFDDNPAGGYAVTLSTTGLTPGAYTYYARGADLSDTGGVSNTVTATNTIVPAPPAIAALVDTPDPVVVGANDTLTATGVTDTDSPVASVSFYRESNSISGLQPDDVFLGTDNNGADGWTLTASTIALAPGTYTYYAVAQDTTALFSAAAVAVNTVSYPPDRFEPNDSFDTATDSDVVDDRFEAGLSLHTPDDVDYFKFFSARATVMDVTIGFTPSAPMTLVMYDAGRHQIARSDGGASGYAAFRVKVGSDQQYWIETLSAAGVVATPTYSLRIISTPSIGSLTVNPSPAPRERPITLTANNVVDEGQVTVSFYRESNGTPGLQPNDTLLGEDSDGTNGYSIGAIAESPLGTYTYYAVGRDVIGFSGDYVTTTLQTIKRPPSIASLSVSPYPASPGGKITLIPNGVSNLDSGPPTVVFYHESNGIPGLQPDTGGGNYDEEVAANGDPDGGYVTVISVGNLPAGFYTYYAYASDPATGSTPVGVDAPKAVSLVPLPGDANLDGTVNFPDLVILAQNYNGQGRNFTQGDFNYDTKVDFTDLVMLAQRYGTSLAAPPLAAPESIAPGAFAQASTTTTKTLFSLQPVRRPPARATKAIIRRH